MATTRTRKPTVKPSTFDFASYAGKDGVVTPSTIAAKLWPDIPQDRAGRRIRRVIRDVMPRQPGEPKRSYGYSAKNADDVAFVQALIALLKQRGSGGTVRRGADADAVAKLKAMIE